MDISYLKDFFEGVLVCLVAFIISIILVFIVLFLSEHPILSSLEEDPITDKVTVDEIATIDAVFEEVDKRSEI